MTQYQHYYKGLPESLDPKQGENPIAKKKNVGGALNKKVKKVKTGEGTGEMLQKLMALFT